MVRWGAASSARMRQQWQWRCVETICRHDQGDVAMLMFKKKLELPSAAEALPGRPTPIPTAREHFIFHRPLKGPYPAGLETAMFGMGCFWGAERKFWEL